MGVESGARGEIVTSRLVLRRWREADFEGYAAFWSDHESTRFVGGPICRQMAWSRFLGFIGHWELRGFGYFVLEDRQSTAVIGYCGFRRPLDSQRVELGWAVYDEFRGRGFAAEAATAALRLGFDAFHWTDVVSLIDERNLASIAVATKLGGMPDPAGKGLVVYRYQSCWHADA